MADDKYTFEQARIRLEEIAVEVRKKDTSLEKSLDLLEEGVRLANICTELVDHTDTSASVTVMRPEIAELVDTPPTDEAPEAAEAADLVPEADSSDASGEHDDTSAVDGDDEIDGFEDVDGTDDDLSDPASPEVEQ